MDLPRGFVGYWQPFGAGHIVRTNKKTFSYGTLHFPAKNAFFAESPRLRPGPAEAGGGKPVQGRRRQRLRRSEVGGKSVRKRN